jgi:hypothetical protein
MNGFGFIEYSDAMDARDVVPGESLCYFVNLDVLLTSLLRSLPYVSSTRSAFLKLVLILYRWV